MKKIILLFVLMFSIYNGVAQELYSKTFGNANGNGDNQFNTNVANIWINNKTGGWIFTLA